MPTIAERVLREHNRYTGDGLPNEPVGAPLPVGDPASGPYHPSKKDLRDALDGSIAMTTGQALVDQAGDFADQAGVYATAAAIAVEGHNRLTAVACATTANITLSGLQTIDGVSTGTSRVLVKNQTTTSQNGIYVSASGAWTRAADANTSGEIALAYVHVIGGTANGGKNFQVVDSPVLATDPVVWAEVGFSVDLLLETADRIAADKLNLFELAAVASADGMAYTATLSGLTKDEVEDGTPRLFVFAPNITNTGAVTMQIGGAGTARLVRTQDDLPLIAGQLRAGVRYLLVADGFRFFVIGARQETLGDPTAAQIAHSTMNGATADEARRRSAVFVTGQLPADYDPIVLPNEAGPMFVGLQAVGRLVHVTRAGQDIDLNFVKPGTTVRLIVRNGAGNASARLQIPASAAVLGPAAATHYDVPNGSLIEVTRSDSGGVDLFSLRALHGSIAVAASLTDAARARGIIFAGQSLALRFSQGYGPMALQSAFAGLGLTAATRIVQTAAGSSSLFFANDNVGGNHWWDERTNVAGPLAIAAVATINAHMAAKPAGEPAPALMVFNIGQNDADNIANSGTTTIATVRDHYRKVMAYIRANTGLSGLITAIDLLGSDDGGAYSDAQCSMFRRAQLAACKTDGGADDPLIRPGIETFDLPRLWDDVHICLAGQTLQAGRYADLWQALVAGVPAKKQGLEIISHTFTAPNIHTVRVQSSDWSGVKYGTRRPASHIPGGIAFLANAIPLTSDAPFVLSAWSITATGNANELDFNFVTALNSTGAVCVTNWGRGANEAMQGRNLRDILTDRSLITRDPRPIV